VSIERRAVLPHHHHPPIVRDRNDHDRRPVPHDDHFAIGAVGTAAGVDFDVEDAAVKDDGHMCARLKPRIPFCTMERDDLV
jgi:hypothetical protein